MDHSTHENEPLAALVTGTRALEMSMTARKVKVLDGNEAAASVAFRLSEVVAIYPITPSSPMGEFADMWAAAGRTNIWGSVPEVVEMQSEGGAAGAVHGSLTAGALTTSFTASQGLLLMLPNMLKIAGELLPCCLHVAARAVATHALSIFGDHSDVMAVRSSGFAQLVSTDVQEAHDLAAVAHAATLAARVPILHVFDGFRTSLELQRIELLSDDDLRALVDERLVQQHRERGLTPERPVLRGTAQNPDVFFQAREAGAPYHAALSGHLREALDTLAERTGRRHELVSYAGHSQAEQVLVAMGSGAVTASETARRLAEQGRKVGVITLRLFRPFPMQDLVAALPASTRQITVLDRTKEPGAAGEPLYQDVVCALSEADAAALPSAGRPDVYGARYGLGSKEFTPGMVAGLFDELCREAPRRHATVGIVDDVSGSSIDYEPSLDVLPAGTRGAVFFGLGSDGTVGANKNSIKILGELTDLSVQGYFVYDSKKAGAMTVSHLRFGKQPIRAPYLVALADFVGVHQLAFLDRHDVLARAADGATLLLNAPYAADELWSHLPQEAQQEILDRRLVLWVVDADMVASEQGLGGRINTVMQTCFFALAELVPVEEALKAIKDAITKSYGKRGELIVARNHAAVDAARAGLERVTLPASADSPRHRPPAVPSNAPDFVQAVTGLMLAGRGDELPVSAFAPDGTWPTGTSRFEKRNIAASIPIWDAEVCVQCNQCALVCPHAAIRTLAYEPAALADAPADFPTTACRIGGLEQASFSVQVAPEDCTGCSLCVNVCPAKDRSNPRHKAIDMQPHAQHVAKEAERFAFFDGLTGLLPEGVPDARTSQLRRPLFEFSGACAGCGETPYIKLATQLFGERMLIANATGCSSIFGGNLPTTPYTTGPDGRGPAWANSLFEDNAEFGLGMRLAEDQAAAQARALVTRLADDIGLELAVSLCEPEGAELEQRRQQIEQLRQRLAGMQGDDARRLERLAEHLSARSIWLIGGDGWAYDIGYGGLDHVLASHRDVNVLVLDTEVYSNTGGQASKATPLGAAAKYATAGKSTAKKDLGLEAMSYGHVYVARVAFGAKPNQTVTAMREAEAHRGPSLIIAYSPCVAHGYDLSHNVEQQRLIVSSGVWPLYRFDPARARKGLPPLQLDSPAPRTPVKAFMANETRFRMVERLDPQRYARLQRRAQEDVHRRHALYEQLSRMTVPEVGTAAQLATGMSAAAPATRPVKPEPETAS